MYEPPEEEDAEFFPRFAVPSPMKNLARFCRKKSLTFRLSLDSMYFSNSSSRSLGRENGNSLYGYSTDYCHFVSDEWLKQVFFNYWTSLVIPNKQDTPYSQTV